MSGRILVAVDGSELSLQALDAAIELSKSVDASIEVLYVVDIARAAMLTYGNPEYVTGCLGALHEEGESALQAATQRAASVGATIDVKLLEGNPVEEILERASRSDVRWIVMGSHGRTGLSRILVGSVAEGVLRRSPVPVMIVPMQRETHHSHAASHTEAGTVVTAP
jgi:nucleotide-binding universal stress UspA family protein